MPHELAKAAALGTIVALAGCSAPEPKALLEPLSIRVTAVNTTEPVRFTMDVTGGSAEFNTPELRGRAGEPSLTASTPAEVVLAPGITSASFRALDGARLEVTAVTSHGRLTADGARVRISATSSGPSIRDF